MQRAWLLLLALTAAVSIARADERINLTVSPTSEIQISVLLDRKYMALAVQALHDTFDLDKAA